MHSHKVCAGNVFMDRTAQSETPGEHCSESDMGKAFHTGYTSGREPPGYGDTMANSGLLAQRERPTKGHIKVGIHTVKFYRN